MPGGCCGIHAWSVHLRAEQTAGRERHVAHHLGLHSHARTAGEQPIVGVAFVESRAGRRGLAVGGREHNRAQDGLLAPLPADELRGEPVEQFRMRRHRALGAEVLARLDQTPAEDLLPESVDGDPRDERIVLVDEPAGEAQPVHRQLIAHRMEGRWRARVDPSGPGREAASFAKLVGRLFERWPLLHDERRGNLQVGQRLARRRERVARWLERRRRRAEERVQIFGLLLGSRSSTLLPSTGLRRAGSSLPSSGSLAVVADRRKRPMP